MTARRATIFTFIPASQGSWGFSDVNKRKKTEFGSAGGKTSAQGISGGGYCQPFFDVEKWEENQKGISEP